MKTLKNLTWIFLSFFMVSFAAASTGCLQYEGADGNGKVVKEERNVSGFSRLEVSGAFDVHITQGDVEKLVVEADENLMELIKTEVIGNRLEIYSKGNIRDYEMLKIHLTYKALDEIRLSGAVDLTTENLMKAGNLKLDVSGAAELDMSIEAGEIEADFSGASDVDLSGYARKLEIDLSGAGELDALELEADVVRIDVSGAASAKVHAKDELQADVSGAANLRYKGDPKVYSDVSGASSIKEY